MENFDDQLAEKHLIKKQLEIEMPLLESPFTWLPDRSPFAHVDSEYIIKMNTPSEGDKQFIKYARYMRIVYEMGWNGNVDAALEKVGEWKTLLEETTDDPFFEKYKNPLNHIILSSEAILLWKKEEYSRAGALIEEIKKVTFKEEQLFVAGICGLKAAFFDKYGIDGHKKALSLLKEALGIDKNEEKWIYFKAKTLRDIRRSELYNTESSKAKEFLKEEFLLCEELTKQFGNEPIYFIRLGDAYHDRAKFKFHEHKDKAGHYFRKDCWYCRNIIDDLGKGKNLFEHALALENPIRKKTYLRVIRGINNVPRIKKQTLKLFKELAEYCVNQMILEFNNENDYGEVYLAVGKYYQNLAQDMDMAKEYFNKASSLGSMNGEKELIILRHRSDSEYNPCGDIRNRMMTYADRPKKLESFSQIASYWLIINEDLLKAVEAVKELMEEDPTLQSLALRKHRSWFIKYQDIETIMKDYVNKGYVQNKFIDLLKVIMDKVYVELQRDNERNDLDDLLNFAMIVEGVAPKVCEEVKSLLI